MFIGARANLPKGYRAAPSRPGLPGYLTKVSQRKGILHKNPVFQALSAGFLVSDFVISQDYLI
jgi:hypothetical protein